MRPTSYKPEFCEVVVRAGKRGKSKTGMAAEIGVSKDTLYRWVKEFPEFSDAVSLAVTFSQQWWEDCGQDNLNADKFQATVYNRQIRNRFREDHGDVAEVVTRQSGVISSEPLTAEQWEEMYSADND